MAGREDSTINKIVRDNRSKKTVLESFDDFVKGNKDKDDSADKSYSNASDKVAKKTANRLRDSESE